MVDRPGFPLTSGSPLDFGFCPSCRLVLSRPETANIAPAIGARTAEVVKVHLTGAETLETPETA
jgi:hypothetical protein